MVEWPNTWLNADGMHKWKNGEMVDLMDYGINENMDASKMEYRDE